jgi:hypothetical protein
VAKALLVQPLAECGQADAVMVGKFLSGHSPLMKAGQRLLTMLWSRWRRANTSSDEFMPPSWHNLARQVGCAPSAAYTPCGFLRHPWLKFQAFYLQ